MDIRVLNLISSDRPRYVCPCRNPSSSEVIVGDSHLGYNADLRTAGHLRAARRRSV